MILIDLSLIIDDDNGVIDDKGWMIDDCYSINHNTKNIIIQIKIQHIHSYFLSSFYDIDTIVNYYYYITL